MGSWADRRGRKLPLLLGLFGKLYYSAMIVLNATQDHWPVEYIVYTATLPMAFTGADVAIFAACFTYVVDVSSDKNRTIRVTILEVCYLASMPTGIALGSYLFTQVTNKSYATMFLINCSLLVVSIIYSLVRLEWRTSERQRPLSEAANIVTDFFDYKHVVDTFHTLFRRRSGKKRCFLLLLIVSMAFYTFQRNEKQMMYLYLQLVLNWSFQQISNFRTYQSALQDLALLIVIPVGSKLLAWKDGIIAMIGAVAHSVARMFFATAKTNSLIYVGGMFAGLGPIVAPIIRSMISTLVSSSERGKVFTMLAVADNAIPMLSGTVYNQVYKKTINHFPAGIYLVTIFTQMVVFLIFLYIHIRSRDQTYIHGGNDDDDDNSSFDIQPKAVDIVEQR
ncbi:proton-coupled folate transporter isoform X2 [Agrilus planipennis]|nr:proton-coupled folate transporter isoform X2 [Agrilus planipennis]XP_018323963.1 proton-coupled folate transporter isoform X2 [Agrilus planipennis]